MTRSKRVPARRLNYVFPSPSLRPMAVISFVSGLGSLVYPMLGGLLSPWLIVFTFPLSFGAAVVAIWSGRKARTQIVESSESLTGNDGLLATLGLCFGCVPFGMVSLAITVLFVAVATAAFSSA